MTILWCGGEDIDFPAGVPPQQPSFYVSSTYIRTSYARLSLQPPVGASVACSKSLPFSGGAVTSCWLHCQCYNQSVYTNLPLIGLGNSANNDGRGLYIGVSSASTSRVALKKYDGTTVTELAAETGNSIGSALAQLDMQVTSFGASATVKVYVNNTLVITYSGSTAITGVTTLDTVQLCQCGVGGTSYGGSISEIIVADADTRSMSLKTMAPNAAGDANTWDAGTYTNVNGSTGTNNAYNDANVVYVNSTAKDFQANLLDLPSGTFSINMVKAVARAQVTAGATPTGLKLGVKTASTVNVGSANTLNSAFTSYERYMANNPVSAAAWAQSDMNALQLDLQSA